MLARHSPQAELARASERLKGLQARLRQGLVARRALARREAEDAQRRLDHAEQRLRSAFIRILDERRARLDRLDQLRKTLGYEQVLARGFALVRDETGALLRQASDVAPGQRLDVQFSDGHVAAQADGDAPTPAAPPPRQKRGKDKNGGDQGSLF